MKQKHGMISGTTSQKVTLTLITTNTHQTITDNDMIDLFDRLLCRLMIWRIRESFGRGCMDYHKDCIVCDAGRAQDFLKKFIKLTKI